MDTDTESAMIFHINSTDCLKFTECHKGIYYLNKNKSTNEPVMNFYFLSMLVINKD